MIIYGWVEKSECSLYNYVCSWVWWLVIRVCIWVFQLVSNKFLSYFLFLHYLSSLFYIPNFIYLTIFPIFIIFSHNFFLISKALHFLPLNPLNPFSYHLSFSPLHGPSLPFCFTILLLYFHTTSHSGISDTLTFHRFAQLYCQIESGMICFLSFAHQAYQQF